jgi:NarL family two-component system response regulator LiaR
MSKVDQKIHIVLVDDHHVVRRGLRSFLESYPDIAVVGEAANGEEILEKIAELLPDVVVMDVRMPGGIDGIEATRHLRLLSPHTQVVVLTAHTDDARVVAALREGAIGYVRKDAAPEVLLMAVRGAARGQSVLDPAVAGAVLQELFHSSGLQPDELTDREVEVLRQLAQGRTNREIALLLTISEETVKTHVGNILAKLHLAHRTQAALYALKRGYVTLDEIVVA